MWNVKIVLISSLSSLLWVKCCERKKFSDYEPAAVNEFLCKELNIGKTLTNENFISETIENNTYIIVCKYGSILFLIFHHRTLLR